MDENEGFEKSMAGLARSRTLPLWEGPAPVAAGPWPRAAEVFVVFARARPGVDEAVVVGAVATLHTALAATRVGPGVGGYVRMESRKARSLAAIHGVRPAPGRGVDAVERALHRAETCGADLRLYRQWAQIKAIEAALQRVYVIFQEQAGEGFAALWADEHIAGWWRQVSLTACARIADLGLQRATPAAGYGGHPSIAALRDIGRAALLYTALADPDPSGQGEAAPPEAHDLTEWSEPETEVPGQSGPQELEVLVSRGRRPGKTLLLPTTVADRLVLDGLVTRLGTVRVETGRAAESD
ncbi:hypothetical protein ACFRR6_01985 [Streptomyces sp. NPDC056891]|uniref:hypothetical protein n=1 Tax=Streptomyces sp. NPDC056891 TaxID=3345961 RepID=UPI0036B3B95D